MSLSVIEIHRLQNQLVAGQSKINEGTRIAQDALAQYPDAGLTDKGQIVEILKKSYEKTLNDSYLELEKLKVSL